MNRSTGQSVWQRPDDGSQPAESVAHRPASEAGRGRAVVVSQTRGAATETHRGQTTRKHHTEKVSAEAAEEEASERRLRLALSHGRDQREEEGP